MWDDQSLRNDTEHPAQQVKKRLPDSGILPSE